MKRFLYYDEDSINSFLAQMERGLTTQNRNEDEESNTLTSNETVSERLAGDVNAKIIGIGASINGYKEKTDSDADATTKLVKGVQEKVLHDYAFEKVYSYFQEQKLIVDIPNSIGDIVVVHENPTFLDFEYFQKIFSENGVIRYSEEQQRVKNQEAIKVLKDFNARGSQLTPDQKAKIPENKILIKKLEEDLKESVSSRKDTERIIEVIRNTIPYKRSIMTEELLIPCDDAKFRDDPSIVAFKYGGRLTVLGYITNVISSNPDENNQIAKNDFAGLYSSLNQIMLNLFKDKEKVFILHPVAIYY